MGSLIVFMENSSNGSVLFDLLFFPVPGLALMLPMGFGMRIDNSPHCFELLWVVFAPFSVAFFPLLEGDADQIIRMVEAQGVDHALELVPTGMGLDLLAAGAG